VIAAALENNRDLRVAALNIEKARADIASPMPTAIRPSPPRAPARQPHAGRVVHQRPRHGVAQQSVTVGVSAYELDFFGRLKNLSDAALETYQYQVETRRSTHISLVAEVATAWLTLASDRELLKLAQDTYASQSRTFELSQRSRDIGTVSGVDLASQEATVQAARADVASYTSQVAQDINALRLLVGPMWMRRCCRPVCRTPPAYCLPRLRACRRKCCCVARTCWRPSIPEVRQCRHRCGARGLLPQHFAHR
jgi:multidrug efflux system outer membrane protein